MTPASAVLVELALLHWHATAPEIAARLGMAGDAVLEALGELAVEGVVELRVRDCVWRLRRDGMGLRRTA